MSAIGGKARICSSPALGDRGEVKLCPGKGVIAMTNQLAMFEKAEVEVEQTETTTRVRVGKRAAQIPLRAKRREALERG